MGRFAAEGESEDEAADDEPCQRWNARQRMGPVEERHRGPTLGTGTPALPSIRSDYQEEQGHRNLTLAVSEVGEDKTPADLADEGLTRRQAGRPVGMRLNRIARVSTDGM